jgi:antitoxin ParD1/3/4
MKRDERHQLKLEKLRRDIQLGIDQADRGQVMPLTDELIAKIKAEGRKRLAKPLGPNSE